MTVLSVNVNKIALLRNSRGRDFPNVVDFVSQLIALGVKGITVHPRPDERHITRADVYAISELLTKHSGIEFNIEGFPTEDFLALVEEVAPAQCTLVPDSPDQLTSDHGWDVVSNRQQLMDVIARLKQKKVRSSLFLDPSLEMLEQVPAVGADRIELYTEAYAASFGRKDESVIFDRYLQTAVRATQLNIGINAGHDLNLQNLPRFLQIPGILEVSIGHALVVESIQSGLESVITAYLAITAQAAVLTVGLSRG